MMKRLIDDLLDLARADSGTLTLSRQSHDLAEIVTECVAMASTAAERKRVRIALDLAPAETRAFCDRGRVLQIVGNLIGNALKFTPEEGTIVVGTRVGPEDGQVRVWIADTGPGVAPEEQPFVFDRYWQSPQANHSGVGLGLSIVKAMVEAQGGKVSLTSRKGEGARFEFTLPTEEVSRAGTRRPSVLVVDDDPDIRASLAQVLEEVGYRAIQAADGVDALEVLRHQDPALRPSVILLDMMMPRMDGREFRTIQRRDPVLSTIPVLVFSAQRDVSRTAVELGVEGYLEKPLRMGALLEAVARCAATAPESRRS
jgi:CheY-like chemotaxis protein